MNMQFQECAACATPLTDINKPCPKCGSVTQVTLISLLDIIPKGEQITLTISYRNRVWEPLPGSLHFLLEQMVAATFNPFSQGLSMQVINTTAVFVEGVITDCLEEEIVCQICQNNLLINQKHLDMLNGKGWQIKKQLVKEILHFDIAVLNNADEADILFDIRNNIAHGRSYTVNYNAYFRHRNEQNNTEITILNKKYSRIHLRLETLGLLPPLQQNGNLTIELFFKPKVAKQLYDWAISFLTDFFDKANVNSTQEIKDAFFQCLPN